MAPKQLHPPGPPMTLGNMREQGADWTWSTRTQWCGEHVKWGYVRA
jgi:hypothetical protein